MFYVRPEEIRDVWATGAHVLTQAVEKADGDMTPEALIQDLESGTKTLLGHEGGWVVVSVQVYPTKRVLHVDAIHAPGLSTPEVFSMLADFAKHNGCECIQGACQPAVARLWKRKFGFREAYIIVRKEIQ